MLEVSITCLGEIPSNPTPVPGETPLKQSGAVFYSARSSQDDQRRLALRLDVVDPNRARSAVHPQQPKRTTPLTAEYVGRAALAYALSR